MSYRDDRRYLPQDLCGVLHWYQSGTDDLKRRALLFDTLALFDAGHEAACRTARRSREFEYLQDRGVLTVPSVEIFDRCERYAGVLAASEEPRANERRRATRGQAEQVEEVYEEAVDRFTRAMATVISLDNGIDAVAVCRAGLKEARAERPTSEKPPQTVIRVALEALPVPDDSHSWEDILDFKASLADKRWGFRRFLRTLATKSQTEAEIRDEIEWFVNDYRRAMEIHKVKASSTFVEAYVVPTLEVIENLATLKFSKVLKGGFAVRKRQADLLEAEMKAAGRECAYVFESRERFKR
jgi:hypothetical protein